MFSVAKWIALPLSFLLLATACDFDTESASTRELDQSLRDLEEASDRLSCLSSYSHYTSEYYACLSRRSTQRELGRSRQCNGYEFGVRRRVCSTVVSYSGTTREECRDVVECANEPISFTREGQSYEGMEKRNNQTIGQAMDRLTGSDLALIYRIRETSADALLGAVRKALEGNSSDALNLGLSDDDLKAISRKNISGVSQDSIVHVAKQLDIKPEIAKGILSRFILLMYAAEQND